jgi:hypothetical protein
VILRALMCSPLMATAMLSQDAPVLREVSVRQVLFIGESELIANQPIGSRNTAQRLVIRVGLNTPDFSTLPGY